MASPGAQRVARERFHGGVTFVMIGGAGAWVNPNETAHAVGRISNPSANPASLDGLEIRPTIERSLRRSIEDDVDPSDHHFFPRLIAPRHRLGRIRIVRVLRGVIKVGDAMKL